MSRIQQGISGLVYQGRSITWSPHSGIRAVEKWMGDVAAVESALVSNFIGTLTTASVEPLSGGKANLIVERGEIFTTTGGTSYGGSADAYVHTAWSMHPSWEKRSLIKSTKVRSEINALSTGDQLTFKDALDAAKSGLNPTTEIGSAYTTFAAAHPGLDWVVREYRAGDETYDCVWPTLKKSRTCSQNTSVTSDWTDIAKIWTTSQLVAAETTIPSAIIGTIPTGDWLKLPGTVETIGDGRVTISTEWHYRDSGLWDDIMVSGATWKSGVYTRKT